MSTGVFAYGGYPDIDELFKQQEVETDRSKREALLHKMQQLVHERRDVRTHLSLCVAERHRAAGGGAGAMVDQALPLGCSPGRGAPEAANKRTVQRRHHGMNRRYGILLLVVAVLALGWAHDAGAQTTPSGDLVWALHVSISPSWFDPGENGGLITPFAVLYALHDGVVRPMPGQKIGNSLAASWTESPDGLVYEFKLRQGLRFHNGDPCTAEDVKFSFDRYKGGGAAELRANVQRLEVVDPLTVRFHLQAPWPDFLTFYGTSATAAGLIVPKKYLEQVGEEGFKKHPIGLGPYKFVSFKPGIELVLEAFEGYWQKVPNVKRLIMKGVPEGTTRLAMLKKGEADLAAAMQGAVAEEVKRDPNLTLVDTRHPSMFWIEFTEQWDPRSVWHDKRVRLAVNYALNRQAISEAACLSYCPPSRGHRATPDGLRPADRAVPL